MSPTFLEQARPNLRQFLGYEFQSAIFKNVLKLQSNNAHAYRPQRVARLYSKVDLRRVVGNVRLKSWEMALLSQSMNCCL